MWHVPGLLFIVRPGQPLTYGGSQYDGVDGYTVDRYGLADPVYGTGAIDSGGSGGDRYDDLSTDDVYDILDGETDSVDLDLTYGDTKSAGDTGGYVQTQQYGQHLAVSVSGGYSGGYTPAHSG